MARKRIVSNLHRLAVREVQAAGDGDHADGGGLLLRARGQSASWVFRYTAATGRRREMGLGVGHRGSTAQAGGALAALTGVRALADADADAFVFPSPMRRPAGAAGLEHGDAHRHRSHGRARAHPGARPVPRDLLHLGQRDRRGAARHPRTSSRSSARHDAER